MAAPQAAPPAWGSQIDWSWTLIGKTYTSSLSLSAFRKNLRQDSSRAYGEIEHDPLPVWMQLRLLCDRSGSACSRIWELGQRLEYLDQGNRMKEAPRAQQTLQPSPHTTVLFFFMILHQEMFLALSLHVKQFSLCLLHVSSHVQSALCLQD